MVYMLWFNFILGLKFIFLCFKHIIIHYHTPKQRKIKFKPRIKLNHNIYIKRDFLVALKAIRSLLFSTIVLVFFISPAVYHRNVLLLLIKKIKKWTRLINQINRTDHKGISPKITFWGPERNS